ncbi:hypothetical protein [Streptomyces sp. NPDC102360]|uniref:hypothetical protein n=1 Tax=Streptomyces sp. NPDC102360 TaxID=3366160 RepID=UPI00380D295F
MADQTAAGIFGATTIRPPLDPELAPVEEARGAVFPALTDEALREISDGRSPRMPPRWTRRL